MFAISRSNTFAVAINQAGGVGAWNVSAELRSALMAAADKAKTPALLMVAQNRSAPLIPSPRWPKSIRSAAYHTEW